MMPAVEVESTPVRAISIRQPWTWAILYGGKRVENRSWYTPYRGPIFIHAGLRIDYDALAELEDVILQSPAPRPPAFCGAVVGTAMLVDCVRADDAPAQQRGWIVGPWCFILEEIRPLARPLPLRGELGLFKVPPRVEMEALAQLFNR